MTVPMVETAINGEWQLLLPEHRAARPEWATGWEVERLRAMREAIEPADVVFDVGAEEGDLSALLALWARAHDPFGGTMVLVEPNPRVWPNVRAIFEANGIPAPACFVGFVGAETALEPERDDTGGEGVLWGAWPACASGPVIGDHGFRHLAQEADRTPTISLDDLVTETTLPDVVTIDVEGAELEVLKGGFDTLENERPVVFCSVHPAFMRDLYGQDADDLLEYMSARGYRAAHLATDHEEHWRFDPL